MLFYIFAPTNNKTPMFVNNAEVAQLVELQPSKLVVASSSLVFRSKALTKVEAFLFYVVTSSEISGYSDDYPEASSSALKLKLLSNLIGFLFYGVPFGPRFPLYLLLCKRMPLQSLTQLLLNPS